MNKLCLLGAAALIATAFLPDVASAQRGGGGMRGGGMGGFHGGGMGGGFRGGGIGGGFRGAAIGGGGFRGAAIGPGFRGGIGGSGFRSAAIGGFRGGAIGRGGFRGVGIAGTGFRCVAILDALEQDLERPVVSANQASLWHCLRLSGNHTPISGYGNLLRL